MFIKSWIDKVLTPPGAFRQRGSRSRKAGPRQPLRQRLRLEVLEHRCLPSAVTVSNSTDVTDYITGSTIADLIAQPGADGTISLREAILASNNTPGDNTITFDPVTSGKPIELTQGELSITKALTITGLGTANTTVNGKFLSLIFNLGPVGTGSVPPGIVVTLDGLRLTGGNGSDAGAIRSQFAMLKVSNSSIEDNTTASMYGSFSGGGIFSQGAVTVSNSTISDNSATGGSLRGGGSGGIFSQGAVTVIDSTIARNSAGVGGSGGGIFAFNGAAVTIRNSTISGNTATRYGGGILASGNLTISDSTISGNTTGSYSGGGGGIYGGRRRDLTISNSTISDNFAGYGGGILAEESSVTVSNSIVAGNSDSFGAPDLGVDSPAVTNSLIGDNSGTSLMPAPIGAPDTHGNLIGTAAAPIDPLLGPLAENGGPTQTMALLPGSPAIDRAENPDRLASDQRGLPFIRTFGSQTDMGAYEVSAAQADLQVTASPVTPKLVLEGQEFYYTITVANFGPQAATNVFLADEQKHLIFAPGAIPSGGEVTFVVKKTAGAAGAYSDTIIAYADQPDPSRTNNTVIVRFDVIPPVVNGTAGDDVFLITPSGVILNGTTILSGTWSSLTVNGLGGVDSLTVDDQMTSADSHFVITDTTIGRAVEDALQLSSTQTITYDSVENLAVKAGSGADDFFVNSTTVGVTTVINGGDGNDRFFCSSLPAALLPTPLTIDGGGGTNTLDYSAFTSGVSVSCSAVRPRAWRALAASTRDRRPGQRHTYRERPGQHSYR